MSYDDEIADVLRHSKQRLAKIEETSKSILAVIYEIGTMAIPVDSWKRKKRRRRLYP